MGSADEILQTRSAERVALNDHTFRQANEAIRDRADELDFQEPLPLLCECAEESCTDVIVLRPGQYESVRANPRRFFCAPGHERAAAGWARAVERHSHYVVVEKIGRAGELAEMLEA